MSGPEERTANERRGDDVGRITLQFSRLVLAQAVASAAALALSVLVARGLGPAAFGTYSLFLALASVGAVPFVWVTSGIVVFAQEDRERHGSAARSATAILLLLVVAALVVSVAALAAPLLVGSTAFAALGGMTGFMLAYVLAGALVSVATGVLQARHALDQYARVVSLVPVLSLGAIALGFTVLGGDVRVAAAGLIAGQVAAALPVVLLQARRFPGLHLDLAAVRTLGRFAVAYLAGAVQAYLLGYADIVILGLVLAPAAVGQYSIASRIYQQLLVFAQLFGALGLPLLNAHRVQGRESVVADYVRRRVPQILAGVAILCAVLAAVGGPLLRFIFGEGYVGGREPLVVLMVALLVATWRRLLSPVLTSYRILWQGNFASFVASVAFVSIVALTAPLLGGVGAALAMLIAAITDLTINAYVLHRRLRLPPPTRTVALAVAGGALVALPGLAWPDLGVIALLFALVASGYVLLVRRLGVFAEDDVSEFTSVAAPPLVRVVGRRALALLAARPVPRKAPW